MRLALFLVLGGLVACSDPGLRDRSLMARLKAEARESSLVKGSVTSAGPGQERIRGASVIGLVPDHLAHYYAEEADLVVRCDDLMTLDRNLAPEIRKLTAALPGLKVPDASGADLVRRIAGLEAAVQIDPGRPFAFVHSRGAWVAILPTHSYKAGGDRLKAVDAIYAVAGAPEAIQTYEPGFRKGFYLPGDCSLLIRPAAAGAAGAMLDALGKQAGFDQAFLGGLRPVVPADIQRLDLSCRFGPAGMRFDLRAAPGRGTPTAALIDALEPATSTTARDLPSHFSAYLELAAPLGLARLAQRLFAVKEEEAPEGLRGLLDSLGRDTAAMLDLDPNGEGSLVLISRPADLRAARSYFGSAEMKALLAAMAGEKGRLDWTPEAFSRGDRKVGVITGHISRKRLLAWRQPGAILPATMSVLLHGPVFCYVVFAGDKLCLVAGVRSRAEMERLIDRLGDDTAPGEDPLVIRTAMFKHRLAALSVDLAALFNGSREAAPYWHPRGHTLRHVRLRWRLPVALELTSEGGALRLAARLPPEELARAAALLMEKLAPEPEGRD